MLFKKACKFGTGFKALMVNITTNKTPCFFLKLCNVFLDGTVALRTCPYKFHNKDFNQL